MTRPIFTTVSATGIAETRFKTVTFNVSTRSTGKDTAAARVGSDKVLNAVMAEIKRLNDAEDADIDMDGLTCNYSTSPWQEYDRQTNERVDKGYQVNGSVVCTTGNVDLATVIMDALSKIGGATVQQPQFTPDDSYDARLAAYETAVARAKETFGLQCAALGFEPSDFEVVGLPTEEGRHAPIRAMAAAMEAPMADAPPAEIRAGTAEISVSLTLAFARKDAASPSKGKPRTRAADGNGKPKTTPRSAST